MKRYLASFALLSVILNQSCSTLPKIPPMKAVSQEEADKKLEADKALADLGNVERQVDLGYDLVWGESVPKDSALGLKYLNEAAKAGNEKAKLRLGELYLKGKAVPKDLKKAEEYISKNPSPNDSLGFLILSQYYAKLPKPNEEKSFEFAKKSADLGNASGIRELAFKYILGQSVNANTIKGIQLLRDAVAKGDDGAMCALAPIYKSGKAVGRRPDVAFQLAEAGAKRGNPYCMKHLASYYKTGSGTEINEVKSKQWFDKALIGLRNRAIDADEGAFRTLARMYVAGDGVEKDPAMAKALFNIAADVDEKFSRSAKAEADALDAELTAEQKVEVLEKSKWSRGMTVPGTELDGAQASKEEEIPSLEKNSSNEG